MWDGCLFVFCFSKLCSHFLVSAESDCRRLVTAFKTKYASALVSFNLTEVSALFHPDIDHIVVGTVAALGKQGKCPHKSLGAKIRKFRS